MLTQGLNLVEFVKQPFFPASGTIVKWELGFVVMFLLCFLLSVISNIFTDNYLKYDLKTNSIFPRIFFYYLFYNFSCKSKQFTQATEEIFGSPELGLESTGVWHFLTKEFRNMSNWEIFFFRFKIYEAILFVHFV